MPSLGPSHPTMHEIQDYAMYDSRPSLADKLEMLGATKQCLKDLMEVPILDMARDPNDPFWESEDKIAQEKLNLVRSDILTLSNRIMDACEAVGLTTL
jgi:hypothetical protein